MAINKKIISYFSFFCIILAGCKGCLYDQYKVHKEEDYLDLIVKDSNIKSERLLYCIDNILKLDTSNYRVRDSINGVKLDSFERVIVFNFKPKEAYHISLTAFPCRIMGINYLQSTRGEWIYNKTAINELEQERIIKRFVLEVLAKCKAL